MSFRFAVPELDASLSADLSPKRLQSLLAELTEATAPEAVRLLTRYLHTATRAQARTDDRLVAWQDSRRHGDG